MNQRSLLAALMLAIVVLLRCTPAASRTLPGRGGGLQMQCLPRQPDGRRAAQRLWNNLRKSAAAGGDRGQCARFLERQNYRSAARRRRFASGLESRYAPNTPSQQAFSLEQFRVYADLTIIPNRLGIYVDEQVAPNGSQNEEAYVRYGSTTDGFYLKGGQFYLPFGWRLQDQTAFVREVTGISMTTPDKGVELGYEHSAWSAEFDLTNGAANATTGSGYQVTTQVVYTKPIWRVGIAGSSTQSSAGDRHMGGLFAGLKTGPIAWLAEGDIVHDDSLERTVAAGLLEGDWRILKGHNLKLTAEYSDPDRAVRNNQQTRYSFVYEYTPLPFLQLRAGYRHYFGIPQNNEQNQQLTFFELHGYF